MGPIGLLKQASKILRRTNYRFAVGGGLAANFYRSDPRLTKDVDLLLLLDTPAKTQQAAIQLIKKLKLYPGLAKVSDLKRAPMMNKKGSPVVMVVGRKPEEPKAGGVDILLPQMKWVPKALERAQHNLIDFGFSRLPTITPEDLIIAKTFALHDNPSRYTDMDDLQSIFETNLALDLPYLCAQFERHRISLPKNLERTAPKGLQRISKAQRRLASKKM